jgi:uncharacterized protein YyaL (SSP411 family)
MNLLRLYRLTGKTEFELKANQILRVFSSKVSQVPAAYSYFMMALDFAIGPSYEVVIVGKSQKKETKDMLKALQEKFVPNKVVIFRPSEIESPEIIHFAKFTKNLSSKEGKATAYVCRNYECALPTTSIESMLRSLDANR